MTDEHRLQVSPIAAAITVLATLLAGAGATYFVMRKGATTDAARAGAPGPTSMAAPRSVPVADANSSPGPNVVVPLAKDAAERAGIEVTSVTGQPVSDALSLPGVHVAPVGCTTIGQIEDDARIARDFKPFNETQMAALRERADKIKGPALEDWKRNVEKAELNTYVGG